MLARRNPLKTERCLAKGWDLKSYSIGCCFMTVSLDRIMY